MNVIIYSVVLLFLANVSAVEVLKQRRVDTSSEQSAQWLPGLGPPLVAPPGPPPPAGIGDQMNSTVFMSVNHYYCAAEEIEDQLQVLYGTKSWTFPTQDVNLTLSYPTVNNGEWAEEEGYIVTGFQVVLYIDGLETRGYIVHGGVLHESLVLTFVSRQITSLSYEFWVYGAPKHDSIIQNLNTRSFKCT